MMSHIRRALRNAAPLPFAAPSGGRFSFGNKRNKTGELESMATVGTLFAVVSALTEATSSVDWCMFRKPLPGSDPSAPRTQVLKHPALDVWNRPNPFYTRPLFVETFQQHYELTGEAYWVIGRAEGTGYTSPLELWPVRPDRMYAVPSATDYLAGYVYRSPDGTEIPLRRDEVIMIRRPNPTDAHAGLSVVGAIGADLESERAAALWNRNFFANSAEPGGIIQVEKRLTDEEFNEMTTRWNEQHRGVARAHRVAVLEQGTWIDRKYTNRDMEFVGIRNLTREIIMEAYSVSKTQLGRTEDVNRATAVTADYVFGSKRIVPRLERIKGALNNDFLPMFGTVGDAVEFDYESPVMEDDEAERAELQVRAEAATKFVDAGWNADDVLAALDLPAMRFEGRRDVPVVPVGAPAE